MKRIIIVLLICFITCSCNKGISSINLISDNNYEVILNDQKHNLAFDEDNNNIKVLFDNIEILSYEKENNNDIKKVNLLYGKKKEAYLAFAIANFINGSYHQYLFIINNDRDVIYKIDSDTFGAAFLDFSNIEEYPLTSLYGGTGMSKLEDDKITYLREFSSNANEDFVRCEENIITIDNNEVTETKGAIIRVGLVK